MKDIRNLSRIAMAIAATQSLTIEGAFRDGQKPRKPSGNNCDKVKAARKQQRKEK